MGRLKTRHEEASSSTKAFDIVKWIRARRLRWLGQIAHMPDEVDKHDVQKERLIKTAVRDIYHAPQEDDLCMDVPVKNNWDELVRLAQDEKAWDKMAENLKAASQPTTITPRSTPKADAARGYGSQTRYNAKRKKYLDHSGITA